MFSLNEKIVSKVKQFLQNFQFNHTIALETGLMYTVGDCGSGCRDTCAGGCATSCSGSCEGGCSGSNSGRGWWE